MAAQANPVEDPDAAFRAMMVKNHDAIPGADRTLWGTTMAAGGPAEADSVTRLMTQYNKVNVESVTSEIYHAYQQVAQVAELVALNCTGGNFYVHCRETDIAGFIARSMPDMNRPWLLMLRSRVQEAMKHTRFIRTKVEEGSMLYNVNVIDKLVQACGQDGFPHKDQLFQLDTFKALVMYRFYTKLPAIFRTGYISSRGFTELFMDRPGPPDKGLELTKKVVADALSSTTPAAQ